MYKLIAINGDKETIIHEDTENSIAFVNSCALPVSQGRWDTICRLSEALPGRSQCLADVHSCSWTG